MYIVYVCVYIYNIYMYACDVQSYCVCVCEDVREGMMERKKRPIYVVVVYIMYTIIFPRGKGIVVS